MSKDTKNKQCTITVVNISTQPLMMPPQFLRYRGFPKQYFPCSFC